MNRQPSAPLGLRSSFIFSLAHQRGRWRVALLDLRSGERHEFDSLEAAFAFLRARALESGLR